MTFKKITLSDFITNSLNIQTKECYISREKNQKNNIKKLGSGLTFQPQQTPVDFKVPFYSFSQPWHILTALCHFFK